MSDLRNQLRSITDSFVSAVLAAMKGASIGDLAAQAGAPRGPAPKARASKAAKPAVKATKEAAKPAPLAAKAAAPAAVKRPAPAAKRQPAAKATAPSAAGAKDRVLGYVKAHPNERSEKIRAALGLARPVYLRAVSELLAAKKIAKKGDRRKTTFSAVG